MEDIWDYFGKNVLETDREMFWLSNKFQGVRRDKKQIQNKKKARSNYLANLRERQEIYQKVMNT